MVRDQTPPSNRFRRRQAHKHPPRAPLSSLTSSVSRFLVVWSLCLTLQQAPRVASSAASSFSGTVGPGAWQQRPFRGSPSSDDEGSDHFESNAEHNETQQSLTSMVIPDSESTGEEADSVPQNEALQEEESPEDHEEPSNVPLLDSEWQGESHDGITGVTMLESDQDDAKETEAMSEDVPEISDSEDDHIVVVSGVEVEWFDSDDSASVATGPTSAEGQPGHAKAVVKDEVEEGVVKPNEKPRQFDKDRASDQGLSLRQAISGEEIMDESDSVDTEEEETEVPREPLHQAMAAAAEELMDESDKEEEAEAPLVSSSVQQAAKESEGELKEEDRATEDALPLRQVVAVEEIMDDSDGVETEEVDEAGLQRASSPTPQVVMDGSAGKSEEEGIYEEQENPTQKRSVLQTLQEIESEDESSNWSEDEKSVTDDGESDIDDAGHSATSPHHAATSQSSEHGTAATPQELAEAAPQRAHRTKSVAIPYAQVVPSRNPERNNARSKQWYQHPSTVASSSQPLKTLKKLQQMLDETDYMTAAPGPRGDEGTRDAPVAQSGHERVWFDQELAAGEYGEIDLSSVGVRLDSIDMKENNSEGDKLWTSKDRMKYKKQQQRIRRAKAEQHRIERQLQSPPLYPNTSDGEITEDSTDDGLGYTLPNLPVYFSDAEGTTDVAEDTDHPLQLQHSTQQQSSLQPPPPPFEQRGPYQYPGYHYPYSAPPLPEKNMGQIPPYMGYPPNPYIPYPPYGPYGPQQQQMYGPQQQQMVTSQYAAWAAASTGMSPYGAARPPHSPYPRQTAPRKPDFPHSPSTGHEPKSETAKAGLEIAHKRVLSSSPEGGFPVAAALTAKTPAAQMATTGDTGQLSTLVESTPHLNFDSLQKVSILAISVALSCYSAVSPRTLPTVEYNIKFFENIKTVALAMIAPIFHFVFVFDPKENNVNRAVNALFESVTVGYGLTFLLQIVFTTLIRLVVFAWFEPDVFKLTPHVPALVLPWVLRENQYRPKRITLFAADYATSCVAGPIIEEYVKLKILQWSSSLPRNFRWTTKVSTKNKKHKRKVAEVIPRTSGDPEVTNINSYVSQMLAVSIGIKLCDSTRRILMYTKDHNANKGFYALCRGIFPIHELCGTMTALALAKRDVLGWDMPLWKMLAPAVVVHGMANFRGMKPIFKWNSSTPWSEMQLAPWNTAVALNKGFAQFMWLVILGRVLGYCVKNYYLIRRQAVKRTTTYAGKRSAFSAELAAAEMLKKTAKDK